MMSNAWMSLAACVGDDNGATYRALPEPDQLRFCRHDCAVMAECRTHILAISTALKADEAVVAGGMSPRQIAAEVRRRDHGKPPADDDLISFLNHEIELALIAS